MPTGRRFNLPVPHFSRTPWEQARSILENYLRRLVDTDSGLPAPHANTHLRSGTAPDASDPLRTPVTPATLSASTPAAVGAGGAPADELHVHAITIDDASDILAGQVFGG